MAVIERAGTSPCTFNCPAGIKAHGYVALVRSGEYEKAFELIAEATPHPTTAAPIATAAMRRGRRSAMPQSIALRTSTSTATARKSSAR